MDLTLDERFYLLLPMTANDRWIHVTHCNY